MSDMFDGATSMTQTRPEQQAADTAKTAEAGGAEAKQNLARSDSDIQAAVNAWCSGRAAAEATYGHIRDWDVSAVTSMGELFQEKGEFDDDISKWDVSKVTNMSFMFREASAFNQPIGEWTSPR